MSGALPPSEWPTVSQSAKTTTPKRDRAQRTLFVPTSKPSTSFSSLFQGSAPPSGHPAATSQTVKEDQVKILKPQRSFDRHVVEAGPSKGEGDSGEGKGQRRRRGKKDLSEAPKPFMQKPVILERKSEPPVILIAKRERTQDLVEAKSTENTVTSEPLPIASKESTATKQVSRAPSYTFMQSVIGQPMIGETFPSNLTHVIKKRHGPSKIQLVDPFFKLHAELAFKILNDRPGSYVVGVLGHAGVGKTMIAQTLSGTKPDYDFSTGVEMYKCADGLIVLDSCPIFCRGFYERYKRDLLFAGTGAPVTDPLLKHPDLWLEHFSLQLGILLFSICHVVVVVSDKTRDEALWSFIRKVENEIYSDSNKRPDRSMSSEEERVQSPEVVFVFNKLSPQELSIENYTKTVDLVGAAFQGSRFRISSSSIHLEKVYPTYRHKAYTYVSKVPNVFFLPYQSRSFFVRYPFHLEDLGSREDLHKHLDLFRGCPDRLLIMLRKFRNLVLEVPRFYLALFASDQKAMLSNFQSFQVSERDWLRTLSKVTDMLRRNMMMSGSLLADRGRGRSAVDHLDNG